MLSFALRRTAMRAANVARLRQQSLRILPRPTLLASRHVSRLALPISQLRKAFSTTSVKAEEAGNAGSPSGPPPPPKRRLPSFRTFLKYSAYTAGSTVVGVFVLTGCIFLHDAFTYNEKVRRSSSRDSLRADPAKAHRGCACRTFGFASGNRRSQEPSNRQVIFGRHGR